ncbi:Sensor protein FixL [Fundidesulfovibrio magnetotacticus]|uniref:histidine kinase n=1 Tax=Fundidesulfovibrio magnetotacticus TaxID=2730080 RepID=A0A6V8LSM3_9BACT|nr:PAS domain S-box protein [Fundidesulfovibrio magnetotacticus]GFK94744.1 Sensor protein FixL [Fundidesulfovibrio magnetotacticus]
MGNPAQSAKNGRFDVLQNNAVAICYGVSTLIVLILFVGVYFKCLQEKRLDIEAVFRDTSNISRAVEEHAIRTFEQASLLALSIRSRYQEDDKLDLGSVIKVDPKAMSIFQQLAIINEKGFVSASSIPGFAPVDLSGREHFKVHATPQDIGLFVSKPVLGKVSGKWSIQLTTRLTRADKSFAGVVVVSLDPFYLSSFYQDIDIGPHGSIILVGHDGVIRAQKNMSGETVGTPLDDATVRFLRDTSWRTANYTLTDPATGQAMLCSFRSVEGFPLSVVISVSEADALAGYHARRAQYLGFAAGLSVLIYLLAAWMTRVFTALRQSAGRLRIIFDNSPVGIMHLSADGRVLDCNQLLADQMGTPREAIIGFDAARRSAENLRDHVHRALQGTPSVFEGPYTSTTGVKTSFLRMICNPVNPEHVPNEVIVTSEDISERLQAQERLRITSERLRLATHASGIGIWELDVAGDALVWDDTMHHIYGVEKTGQSVPMDQWRSMVHPEDLPGSLQAIESALRGEADFDVEYRIIRQSDGQVRHIKANALVDRGPDGALLRMVGANMDITARKTAELELQAAYAEIEQRVALRTKELDRAIQLLHGEVTERRQAHREINQILSSISAILIGIDREGRVARWNGAAEHALGLPAGQAVGRALNALPLKWDWDAVLAGVAQARELLVPRRLYNVWYQRPDGGKGFFVIAVNPVRGEDGQADGLLILGDDISEIKFLEAKLSQAAKLEAVGQLASGIAHEINTPTQFVGDSVQFLKDTFTDMERVLALTEAFAAGEDQDHKAFADTARATLEEIDIGFIREETPRTFARIFDGIERIGTIVQAMKRFSHSGGEEMQPVNIHQAIRNTLTISRNEWKYVAQVRTDFDESLKEVPCHPGEINQVLLNIIVNAAHAIGDAGRTGGLGVITISTRKDGDTAEIRIADNGPGIPEAVQPRVFEMFFTTKEVGKGSGQGLAISHDIVVNKHKGSLTFETAEGAGATFIIRLPLRDA